jgi:predicted DNA-binding transcriptional regulator AlpA
VIRLIDNASTPPADAVTAVEVASAIHGDRCPATPRPPDATASTMLLTAADLARELRLNIKTIRRMDMGGRLPEPVRLSRTVRWRAAEVRAWVAAGCPPRDEWHWSVNANGHTPARSRNCRRPP